jgi:hypothetical protein
MKTYLIITSLILFWACGSSIETRSTNSASEETNSLNDSYSVINSGFVYQYIIQLAGFETEADADNFILENKALLNSELSINFNEFKKLYYVQLPVFNSRFKAEEVFNSIIQKNKFSDAVMIIKKINIEY